MALRKNTKTQAISPEISLDGDLSARLNKISEHTGLSPQGLLCKWILQEETFIGLMMQLNKKPNADPTQASTGTDAALPRKSPAQKKVAETVPLDPSSPDYYRNALVQTAKQLKNEGMTLKKIAETLNEEKAPTLSGAGKWYASSVARLLNSKK